MKKEQRGHGTDTATEMGRSPSETQTVWTNDSREAPFSTQGVGAVPCSCWCWNLRRRQKHCQGWKSAVCFSRRFTEDLQSWLLNYRDAFSFFAGLSMLLIFCVHFFFSSERFPIPREKIVDLSSPVFFPTENHMLVFDWAARANLDFNL